MKLWCFDDAHQWGQQLHDIALSSGHDARMFTRTGDPTDGHVLIAMHSHPAVREYHRRMVQHAATLPDVTCIPQYRVAMLNDDKNEQLRQFARWLPPTRMIRNPSVARVHVDSINAFPVVSKSSQGGGIRYLTSRDELLREVKLAWSDLGIKNRHGLREHGFVYWQNYMGVHEHIWRVVVIGKERILVKRAMRHGDSNERPTAPVKEFDGNDLSVMDFVDGFIAAEHFRFGALDIMRGDDNQLYLIKVLVTFQLRTLFESVFMYSGRRGTSLFHVMMHEMEAGNL